MLREITPLQSAIMCGHYWPHNSNPSLVRSCRANVGPTTVYFNCWNFSVGPRLGQCQHANKDMLKYSKPLSNVGPTIDCYLGIYHRSQVARMNCRLLGHEICKPNCKLYKKHIDASVKERPQTLLVPSEEICERALYNKHIFNTICYFKLTNFNCALRKWLL